MFKKIINKWQAYKDKKFLARLNRVLANNILESDVVTLRDMLENVGPNKMEYREELRDEKFPKIINCDGLFSYF